MKKIALLFAGQGAQVVGMGKDLATEFQVAANLFQRADEILGRKLSEIAWNGPLEELTKTCGETLLFTEATRLGLQRPLPCACFCIGHRQIRGVEHPVVVYKLDESGI